MTDLYQFIMEIEMVLLITSRVACVFRKCLNIDNFYDCKKHLSFISLTRSNFTSIWSGSVIRINSDKWKLSFSQDWRTGSFIAFQINYSSSVWCFSGQQSISWALSCFQNHKIRATNCLTVVTCISFLQLHSTCKSNITMHMKSLNMRLQRPVLFTLTHQLNIYSVYVSVCCYVNQNWFLKIYRDIRM